MSTEADPTEAVSTTSAPVTTQGVTTADITTIRPPLTIPSVLGLTSTSLPPEGPSHSTAQAATSTSVPTTAPAVTTADVTSSAAQFPWTPPWDRTSFSLPPECTSPIPEGVASAGCILSTFFWNPTTDPPTSFSSTTTLQDSRTEQPSTSPGTIAPSSFTTTSDSAQSSSSSPFASAATAASTARESPAAEPTPAPVAPSAAPSPSPEASDTEASTPEATSITMPPSQAGSTVMVSFTATIPDTHNPVPTSGLTSEAPPTTGSPSQVQTQFSVSDATTPSISLEPPIVPSSQGSTQVSPAQSDMASMSTPVLSQNLLGLPIYRPLTDVNAPPACSYGELIISGQTGCLPAPETTSASPSVPSSTPTTFSTVTSPSDGSSSDSSSTSISRPPVPSGAYQATVTTHTMPTTTIVMTMTPTPSADPARAMHHTPTLAWLLPIVILGIPLLLAALFLAFRRYCPIAYARTDRHCPFRSTGRLLAKIPFIAAYLDRRERNRGIRARQQDYMSRRARFGIGGGHSRKGSAAETMAGEREKKDEWLRRDMVDHYAREKRSTEMVGVGPSTPLRPNAKDISSPPTSPTKTLVEKSSRADIREMHSSYGYMPGRLTGDNINEHEPGSSAAQEMTLKEKIRAAREKILREEAEGSTVGTNSGVAGPSAATNHRPTQRKHEGENISDDWVL